MTLQSDRRWAELARELEFTQLDELRARAEGWRNGLGGLTALLAVLVVLKGRDDLNGLPAWARHTATGLVAASFLLLLTGSVLAVLAAHGRPRERILLAGQSLRRWSEREAARILRLLPVALVCCLLGVVCGGAGIGIALALTEAPQDRLVRVTTTTGERCGEFLGSGRDGVALREGDGGGGGKRVTLPARSVVSVTPVGGCGGAK
ncbi:hypothetical protein [Streptomyces sp. NPDC059063]|uniref:hypothetical protein n=1 Tax=unclassified Streptomyces TaxID=2593676 RepID=UPI0036A40FDB